MDTPTRTQTLDPTRHELGSVEPVLLLIKGCPPLASLHANTHAGRARHKTVCNSDF